MHVTPEAVLVGLSINGLGVARCLGRHGIRVIGVGRTPPLLGARSRYVRRVVNCPDLGSDSLIKTLVELGQESPNRRPLFLTSDLHVEVVSPRREELEEYYDIALPTPEATERLHNKDTFWEFARNGGFDVPPTVAIRSARDVRPAVESVGLPCIIKPLSKAPEFFPTFREKAILCNDLADADRVAESSYDFAVPLLAQEWIPGGDDAIISVLHYFNSESEPLVSFACRNIRQTPPIVGRICSVRPIHAPEAVATSEAFFRSADIVGFCSMDFKQPPGTDRLMMIEPTVGRTDWQEAIAHINGVPIVLVGYADLTGGEPPSIVPSRKSRSWVEFEADIRSAMYYIRRGELTWRGWLRSIWPFRPAVAALDDPVPGLAFAADVVRRLFRKLFRTIGLGGPR